MISNEKNPTLPEIVKEMRECATLHEKCTLYHCLNLGTDSLRGWADHIEEAYKRFVFTREVMNVLICYLFAEDLNVRQFEHGKERSNGKQ